MEVSEASVILVVEESTELGLPVVRLLDAGSFALPHIILSVEGRLKLPSGFVTGAFGDVIEHHAGSLKLLVFF